MVGGTADIPKWNSSIGGGGPKRERSVVGWTRMKSFLGWAKRGEIRGLGWDFGSSCEKASVGGLLAADRCGKVSKDEPYKEKN